MSIPGLGQDERQEEYVPGHIGQTKVDIHELQKEQEWRFEVALNKSIEVKITQGTAETFGTELVVGRPYTFVGAKAAVYTWTGCTIEITHESGTLASEYIAEETVMNECINIHFALETMRSKAEKATPENSSTTGPRVLILGPDNAGKTSLAKTLTGYAVRSNRSPVVVGLNPAESILSLPGTLTATVFKTLLEVEMDAGSGWGTSPMSGPNGEIPVKLPLVYYFGGTDPSDKEGRLYKSQITRLALSVQGRMKSQEDVKSSGIIVDTPGSLLSGMQASAGYDLVAHIVSEFSINAIICLGSERLYSDMVRKFDKQPISGSGANSSTDSSAKGLISVVKLPKSGGVVDRDATYMRAVAESQIKAYFYGNPKVGATISLQPRQQQVDFDSLPTVWKRISDHAQHYADSYVGGVNQEDSFLPGGLDESEYVPLGLGRAVSNVPLPTSQLFEKLTAPSPALRNAVLAVMNCSPDLEPAVEQETLRDSSCMGFLYVTDIDEARGKINLLSPVAGRVPNRALVWGEGMEGFMGIVG